MVAVSSSDLVGPHFNPGGRQEPEASLRERIELFDALLSGGIDLLLRLKT
jgi:hypothetical protein